MTRGLFSAKIPHRPPTCSFSLTLSLALSSSSSLVCSVLLFLHKISPWSVCPSLQLFVLCYELGGKQREVRGNGTLGQLVRVKFGTRGEVWRRGNSSGSCIPSAHQAISGATRGGPKQELIRGGSENKEKLTWPRLSDGEENEEVEHGELQLLGKLKHKHPQWDAQ